MALPEGERLNKMENSTMRKPLENSAPLFGAGCAASGQTFFGTSLTHLLPQKRTKCRTATPLSA
jgi:hypothetical protein